MRWRAIIKGNVKQDESVDFSNPMDAINYIRLVLDRHHYESEVPDIVYIMAKETFEQTGECIAEGTTFKLERILTPEE